ncbi:MAG: hypothetical protein WDM71_08670 [Ferruginibacter sp.]
MDTRLFYMMLICGFLAQMTDGSLGMGYGTISTTFLLAVGVSPAIVSSRVHSARVFRVVYRAIAIIVLVISIKNYLRHW